MTIIKNLADICKVMIKAICGAFKECSTVEKIIFIFSTIFWGYIIISWGLTCLWNISSPEKIPGWTLFKLMSSLAGEQ